MNTIYQSIIKTRGLRELDYQREFLTSEYDSTKPYVLAAGTSSGKTFMAIMWLEIFYSQIINKNKRTLIIPYAMKVLRDNFSTELASFNPSFSYCVATTKEELINCLNSDCQVVVALPQSLSNSIDLLPKFNNLIIDEAHQWYGKKTINDIIKKIQPKHQLLLTGTPSRFIAKGDKFEFKFVPVMHLFGLKQVSNVRVEVVSSTYDFKQSDYKGTYGNLKGGKINKKNTDEALISVCKEMLKRIKNPIKQPNASRVTKNVLSVFNQIGKTIVFCHSQKQANAIYDSLNGFKKLTGKVLLSHSDNDPNSENFITFKDNDSYSILVAVDRGKLGFNIPELFNVVDFTLTQSLDMLMQIYGRVLRLSTTDNPKTYYKVATKNTAPYFVDLMTAMLCLTHMEWYSKYNGKNMGGILIPKVLSNTKNKTKSNSTTSKSKSTKPSISIADLGIPLDLNLFKTAYHNNDDKFGTIAWTTLDDCRREFFEIKTFEKLSFEKAREYVRSLNFKSRIEYVNWCKSENRPNNIPVQPDKAYKEWIDTSDWLGTDIVANQNKQFLSFTEAHKIVLSLGLKNQKEWHEYSKTKRPDNIPSDPFRYKETKSWNHWLGTKHYLDVPSYERFGYVTYSEAVNYLKQLRLRTSREYFDFVKSKKCKLKIPSNPTIIYKDYGWTNWLDYLNSHNHKTNYNGWKESDLPIIIKMIEDANCKTRTDIANTISEKAYNILKKFNSKYLDDNFPKVVSNQFLNKN
jgi:superfamily II DNA or RNA helicase